MEEMRRAYEEMAENYDNMIAMGFDEEESLDIACMIAEEEEVLN